MTFKPLWKAPPPDLYKLKPVLGYRNHDITKKRAPAWSFVRYIPMPRQKPEVSPSPFQLMMLKKKYGKTKIAHDMKQGKSHFTTDGGISKKKMQRRRKKHKKKKAPLDDSKLVLTKKQPQEPSIPPKEKLKKLPSRMSIESGRFYVAPADICDLCFPWMKKEKFSDRQDDPKTKKTRRSRSISLAESDTTLQNIHNLKHSFIVIPRAEGRPEAAAEPVCEPHSGIILPSGQRFAFTSSKHALPRPPQSDDVNESTVSSSTPSPKKKRSGSPNKNYHVMAGG